MCVLVCVCVAILPSIATQVRASEILGEWIILDLELGDLIANKRVNALTVYIIITSILRCYT